MPTAKGHESPARARRNDQHDGHAQTTNSGHTYVVPMVHASIPESAVNIGFWSVLVGSVAFGVIDPPLAALIGAGVLIARHRST